MSEAEESRTTLRDHFTWAKEQSLPPFAFEVLLRSGQSFYVKWIFRFHPHDDVITLRIWDLRALSPSDHTELLQRLNAVTDRSGYGDMKLLHPKIDQANLRVRFADITAIVEWHDRIWPVADNAGDEPPPMRIGFESGPRDLA